MAEDLGAAFPGETTLPFLFGPLLKGSLPLKKILWFPLLKSDLTFAPCHFSPLTEIPGSIVLFETSLTFEEVQRRKIIRCLEGTCQGSKNDIAKGCPSL